MPVKQHTGINSSSEVPDILPNYSNLADLLQFEKFYRWSTSELRETDDWSLQMCCFIELIWPHVKDRTIKTYTLMFCCFFPPSGTIPETWKIYLPLSNMHTLIFIIKNLVSELWISSIVFQNFLISSPLLTTDSPRRDFYLFTFFISLLPFHFWMQIQKAKQLLLPTYWNVKTHFIYTVAQNHCTLR